MISPIKNEFVEPGKRGIFPMRNHQPYNDFEPCPDSGSGDARRQHLPSRKGKADGPRRSGQVSFPKMNTLTSRPTTVYDYAELRRRFPHALTKHQFLYLIRQFLPGIDNAHPLIQAIHDSFDMTFENGFAQGKEAR